MRAKTYEQYESLCRAHIVPRIGERWLAVHTERPTRAMTITSFSASSGLGGCGLSVRRAYGLAMPNAGSRRTKK